MDCDQGFSFTDSFANSCATPYATNAELDCTGYSVANLPPPLTPDPAPSCMIVQTGNVTALRSGLHERFEVPCTPNNWLSFPSLPADDPRIVYVYVTSPHAPEIGNYAVPVVSVERFYVTGWDYHATQSPGCPGGNDLHPILGANYSHSLDDGDIWGHFIP